MQFDFDPQAERIVLAQQRLQSAYARTPGAPVPIVEPNAGRQLFHFTEKERLEDLEKMLADSVRWANALAATDNDWPPFLNTFCTVAMVPEAFGCPVAFAEGGVAWAHHIVTDTPQVWELKPVPFRQAPLLRRLCEWIDFVQRRLGSAVPLWTVDIQSPFSVAAQIVESEELFSACYTDPPAVHHLCRMITDFTIEVMQAHLAQMEHPAFPGRNFPSISDKIGLCIADDTPLVMLSPQMYREFAQPYNAELGRIFGGIHFHSCGDYTTNLDNLLTTPTIRSIQAHAGPGEFPLPASSAEDHPFNRARQQVCYFIDNGSIARGDEYRGREQDHYRDYTLPRLAQTDLTGLILQSCGWGEQIENADDALSWTREQVDRLLPTKP